MSLRRKHSFRTAPLLIAIFGFLCLVPTLYAQEPAITNAPQQPISDQQRLQNQKLQEEITQLQLENRKLRGWGQLILSYATLLTPLVAVGGLLITFWKQITDNNKQKELDRQQRANELQQQERNRQEQERSRQQRQEESSRRLEDKFSAVVRRLGSVSAPIQASAVVSIMTFLNPENKDFHVQTYLLLLANLKIQRVKLQQHIADPANLVLDNLLNDLLVAAFEKAIQTQRRIGEVKDQGMEIDLARCCLNRVNLSNLDLQDADFAFSELRNATLTDSILFRSKGIQANLENARLSRANMGEARFQKVNLKGAQFHKTNLVSAVLKEANLTN
ncbi:MAG TPA: pentapeptide repeat-containing protein, partial [Pyrinomonadaceae bacterium]|nr:pentapeptide repeat-containing protein [Pyrinomonadaceae bacterium]